MAREILLVLALLGVFLWLVGKYVERPVNVLLTVVVAIMTTVWALGISGVTGYRVGSP